jgi:hypothetical protein
MKLGPRDLSRKRTATAHLPKRRPRSMPPHSRPRRVASKESAAQHAAASADTQLMSDDRDVSGGSARTTKVLGRFAYFGTVPACIALVAIWVVSWISDGPLGGLKYCWLLALAAPVGLPPLRARLRLDGSVLRKTVIGPWQQSVDLEALESVRWRHAGASASRGSMFVRDLRGRKVRIGVGDFTGVDTWGPLILSSATKCNAIVDDRSRQALEGAGRRDRPKPSANSRLS